jgi:hypothetical protein
MNRRGFLQLLCGTALASVVPAMQDPVSFEWSGFYTAFPIGNFGDYRKAFDYVTSIKHTMVYANEEWAPTEFTGFEVRY